MRRRISEKPARNRCAAGLLNDLHKNGEKETRLYTEVGFLLKIMPFKDNALEYLGFQGHLQVCG